jgi:hypothetical protein
MHRPEFNRYELSQLLVKQLNFPYYRASGSFEILKRRQLDCATLQVEFSDM